jgi:hypothetical protein
VLVQKPGRMIGQTLIEATLHPMTKRRVLPGQMMNQVKGQVQVSRRVA